MSDNPHLPELSRRQRDILSLIVQVYTQSPEPVSSKQLVDLYKIDVSSATIRKEMATLEEMGYIMSPHTSAGRIPTAMGYRYYVREIMNASNLSTVEQRHIDAKFTELPAILDQWLRQAATVLARTASTASLVTLPTAEHQYFKHIELIAIQGRLALMVLVLQGGIVHQRMLNLQEPMSQPALSEAANHINAQCLSLSANSMRLRAHQLSTLEREVVDLAADLMERANSQQNRTVYRDGLSEIIQTFPDSESAQQAVRVYEERAFLNMILNDVLHPIFDDVQVIIAGDDRWQEINRISIVLSRYGVPGQFTGTMGVLGPTNINYGRAISTVRHVSSLLTDMLNNLYQNGDDETNSLPAGNEKNSNE